MASKRQQGVCDLKPNTPDQFWALVDRQGDHWIWLGKLDHKGYGRFQLHIDGQRFYLAHRIAYRLLLGPFEGELDHQCRIRACVRPECLISGPHNEHLRRDRARNPWCQRGHFRGPKGKCKLCIKLATERWRRANPDRWRQLQQESVARHPEKVAERQQRYRKRLCAKLC